MDRKTFDSLVKTRPSNFTANVDFESKVDKDGQRVLCMRTEKIDENGRKIMPAGIKVPKSGMPLMLDHGMNPLRGDIPIGRITSNWCEPFGKGVKLMGHYRYLTKGVSEFASEIERIADDDGYTHGSIGVRPKWDSVEYIEDKKHPNGGYLYCPESVAYEFSIVSNEADHGAKIISSVGIDKMSKEEIAVLRSNVEKDCETPSDVKEKIKSIDKDIKKIEKEIEEISLKSIMEEIKNLHSKIDGIVGIKPEEVVEIVAENISKSGEFDSYITNLLDEDWSPTSESSQSEAKKESLFDKLVTEL